MTAATRQWVPILLALSVVLAVGAIAVRWTAQVRDESSVFLVDEREARWIGFDRGFSPHSHRVGGNRVFLRYHFTLADPVPKWTLRVRMMKWGRAFLDGRPILEVLEPSSAAWKAPHRIESEETLRAGDHELLFVVLNRGGPALLLVTSDELPTDSSGSWQASADGRRWGPARPATGTRSFVLDESFPDTPSALRAKGVWLAAIFALVFGTVVSGRHRGARFASSLSNDRLLRGVLLVAWTLLAISNVARVPATVGFDVAAHLEYVQFIAENGALPLASDGWQAFQAPLYYLLATPLYLLFGVGQDNALQMALLRSLSLLSGVALVEIAHRTARVVFPERAELRAVATLVGGMMPMSLYMAQSPGNEPLASALTALALLPAFTLVCEPGQERSRLFFAGMGSLWGLAILAKVTPLLLAPGLGFAFLWHLAHVGGTARAALAKALTLVASALAVCGWFFVRNMLAFGKPLIGGWEPYSTPGWWQEPGYRSVSEYLAFGQALSQPVYAGARGPWDALYSTVWLDGFASGLSNPSRLPWSHDWMVLGAVLGLLPTALILGSFVTCWRPALRRSRGALLLAAGCVGAYVVAVIDLHTRLPIYSTAKGSYLMGLSPALGILAAAGAEPLLRVRWLWPAVVTWLACWVFAAYRAYLLIPGPGPP